MTYNRPPVFSLIASPGSKPLLGTEAEDRC